MVVAAVGYAVGERGVGIAYARLAGRGAPRLLRRSFRLPEAADDRALAYRALSEIALMLVKRKMRGVRFVIADAAVAAQIDERGEVSAPLALAYVRLRCALNALSATVTAGSTGELTQRARAELALNLAA